MITSITYKVFAERIKRRLSDGYADVQFTITDNLIYLYMYEAIAAVITKAANDAYYMEGVRSVPEGMITTFKFNLSSATYDYDTGEYKVTLPQPPLNLPLGYSILSPFISGGGNKSIPLMAIHAFNKGYALKAPTPKYGMYYTVEGKDFIITADGVDLVNSGMKLHVGMLSPRSATGSSDDTINLPDELMGNVFDIVVAKLTGQIQMPADKVNDGVNEQA